MENGAVHDRNSMLENLRGSFRDGIRRHADQCAIYSPDLTHMGQERNMSEVVRQSFRFTGRPANERSHREVMTQSGEFRTGPSNLAKTDNREAQWFRRCHRLR
jgi:hypothetical protein